MRDGKSRGSAGTELEEEGVELSEVVVLLLDGLDAGSCHGLHLDGRVQRSLCIGRRRVEGRKNSVERNIVDTADTKGLVEPLSHVRVVSGSHLLASEIAKEVLDLLMTTLAASQVVTGGGAMGEVCVRGGVGGDLVASIHARGKVHVGAGVLTVVVGGWAATLRCVDAR